RWLALFLCAEFFIERRDEGVRVRQHFDLEGALLLVHQLFAEVLRQRAVILVTVLLEQGQDLLAKPSRELLRVADWFAVLQQEGVPNLLLPPLSMRDSFIQPFKEGVEGQ